MFNNDFKNLGKSSLAEAAKTAMQDGDLRRQAETHVNEEFGVYSRNAVVREHLAAYDARLEEAYKCMKEGRPLDPVGKEDGDVDNDGDKDKSDKYLLKRRAAIGKAMGKRNMEEGAMDAGSMEGSKSVTKSAPKEDPSTPKSYPGAASSVAAGQRVSNAKASVTPIKEEKTGLVTAGKVKKKLVGSEPRHANPGAIKSPAPGIQPIKEAWKSFKAEKKALKEAKKCMKEDFYGSYDYSNLNESYASFIAEAINTYGLSEEHPVATVENLETFNEAYIAAVLSEAEKCECEKAEKYEKKAEKHKKKMKELKKAKKAVENEVEDKDELKEAVYSFKAARAGKNLGKKGPGTGFKNVAQKAAKQYGSKKRGEAVAGRVLANIRAKHMKEESIEEVVSAAALKSSGLSLRDYMNKQQGKTRVDSPSAKSSTVSSPSSSSSPQGAPGLSHAGGSKFGSSMTDTSRWADPGKRDYTSSNQGAVKSTTPAPSATPADNTKATQWHAPMAKLPSDVPMKDVNTGAPTKTQGPPMPTSNAPKKEAGALPKTMAESVQVGDNKYRIV